jgi:hypothetical protein
MVSSDESAETFRCQAKNFSLTYPQCPLEPEDVKRKLLQDFSPIYILIGREKHEDGEWHLHIWLSFRDKKNIKDKRHFDIFGYHPNTQATKSIKKWDEYCKKGGLWIEHGISPIKSKVKPEIILSDVADQDLFNYCINNRVGYGYYQEEKRRRSNVSIDIVEESPGTMNLFLMALIYDSSKTTVLVGQSGIGKTTWAIKHASKPSIIISHIDDLKLFKPSFHKSIIFDDMSFIQWPLQSQIHIVDRDQPRSIHVRYGVAKLPANTEKIFTCNSFPFTEEEPILRRIRLIKCT